MNNELYAVVIYDCYDGPTTHHVVSIHRNRDNAIHKANGFNRAGANNPDFVAAEVEIMNIED